MDRLFITMILIIVALVTWNIWLQEAGKVERFQHRTAMAKLTTTLRETEAENARLKARDAHIDWMQEDAAAGQIADLQRRNEILRTMNAGLNRRAQWTG